MKHVIETLLEVVDGHRNQPAVSDPTGTFTYGELLAYAECVAGNLQKQGVRQGDRVIVEAPRCKEYAGCLVGCWIMGAVAIPLSDDYPEERRNYIKKDSRYRLSIDEAFLKEMDPSLSAEPVITPMDAEGLVIYTSGSTGNPKGVVHDFYSMYAVAKRNAVHDQSDETERNNVVGLVAPFTFVVGVGLFLAALPLAKHMFIVPDEIRKDPYKLAKYYDDNDIQASFVSPRMVDFMLKHNKSLKVISVGSERISNIYYNDNPVVMNGYGSTELFGGTLGFKIDRLYDNTPIGLPIGEEKAYVLDENNNEVELGELCISGYVAKGYLNRPEETKKAFIRNPFKDWDGYDRMFRTGDIVQRLPDGNLVFIERKDWIIKINGQRVEPMEVENTVLRFPGVREAAVKDFTAQNGITYLAAYYVCDGTVTEEALRDYCKANLTSYMVPAFYIRMDALPLNPNGKLDRKNLPEPDISAFKREYAAPESKTESAICAAVEQVLQCGRIGRNDDFFLLGGDSIKAIEVINELDGLPVDLETFFECRTPAAIARRIEEGGAEEIPFDRAERDAYPLTASQLGVYFAMEKNPATLMYNNPVRISLDEEVDAEKLAAAVEKAVANHRAYRCRIDVAGGLPCMIPAEREFRVERRSVTDMDAALADFVRPFDLAGGELIRACLLEAPGEKALALDAHHIVFDGSTLSVLLKEIARAYEGRELFEEKTSAFDLSAYEEALKASPRYAEAKAHYRQVFEGPEIANDFPNDFPDRGEPAQDSVEWKPALRREDLARFLKGNNLTENSLFLAAYAFVLAKFNGSGKALVCVGESGRHTSMTFNTAGMLVKTIPLPVDLAAESDVADFAVKLQEQFRESARNDAYPFAELAAEYGLSNDFSFVFQNDAFSVLTLAGRAYPVTGLRNPDAISKLTLMVFCREDGYRFSFRYRSDLYRRDIMESFAETFEQVVGEFAKKEYLKDVEMLSPRQAAFLDSCNETEVGAEEKTVPEFFAERVAETPERPCVVCEGRSYTFAETARITDKIAAWVQARGLGRGDTVAILMPRDEWMLLATYGVLKAGCAYEPLDASYPDDRLSFMAADGGAKLLITNRSLRDRLPAFTGEVLFTEDVEHLPEAAPAPVKNSLEDLYVLLYTSGTTGTPKGVMLTHGNVSALVQLNRRLYGIDGGSVGAHYPSFGFDAGMMELAVYPACGAETHIIPEDMRLDLMTLDRYFTEHKVTHVTMTTQVGRQFALMAQTPYLRYLLVGGEALVPMGGAKLSFTMMNLYGPTESSVYVSGNPVCDCPLRMPIGKMVPNVKGYVVDANRNRLPVGAPGEFLVAGRQIGLGYRNRPEKTAEVFIENPFTDEEHYRRIYRTGDVVRWLPDGQLDFIGRHDGQVKVRGFRVELTEVEEIVRRFPGVTDAAVAAFDDPAGGKFLAAYVVSGETLDLRRFNEFILAEKPPYMVPAVTLQLDAIPRTRNQKLNRAALPKPEPREVSVTPPENAVQEKLLAIVREVIGREAIGIDTDLYEAGLTSIGGIRLNVELEKAFGVPFRTADVRANSTVRALDAFIGGHESAAAYEILPDYPVTRTQMGIYIECSANPGSVTYNIPALLKLGDGVDTEKLARAAETALDAHPYVKTTLFPDRGGNIRARRNDGAAPRVELVKCEKLPAGEELVKPFTLLGEPLYRVTVFDTAAGKYLFMDFHHIISDGTSEAVLLADIDRAYAGVPVEKETYTGFEAALDEETARETPRFAEAKTYYDSVFQGCETACLPPPAAVPGTAGPATLTRTAETAPAAVEACCRRTGVTPNAFFNAAFGCTLGRFGNFEDAVFTTVYNGRSDSRLSRSVTMLVKTLPVLVRTGENRLVADLLRETGEQLRGSMANDIYSFAEISAAYGIRSDIIFVYQGDDFLFNSLAGEPAELVPVGPAVAKAPLTLNVYLSGDKYRLVADYRQEQYSPAFIESFLDAFDRMLKGLAEKQKTGSVSLLSPAAEAALTRFNDTARPIEDLPAHRFFERRAAAEPEAAAVICEDRVLTCREANAAANRMAHRLMAAGVKKDTPVGMLLPRSEWLPVCELAILKAGGAFLPMLPEYPDERVDYCLRDASAPVLITTAELAAARTGLPAEGRPYRAMTLESLLAEGNEENPDTDVSPDSLAYCIYTSGSTGNPKGVMIEHRNLSCLVQPADFPYRYHFGDRGGTVGLAVASVSFDMSVVEMMAFLVNGKATCVATEREIHNPLLLAERIRESGADVLLLTPSMLTNLLGLAEFLPAMKKVKCVCLGAEMFPPKLFETLKALSPDITVLNGYGPTECTATCSAKKLDSAEGITIGGPSANTGFYIMDRFGNVQPPYACGELIIAGGLVGRGYVNLPEKTREAFFTLRGQPAYHSGDLARLNAAGEAELFGRRDNQVKLRGFRVELDEVEKCLSSFPGVTGSKVVVRSNGSEDYLAGFFTASEPVDTEALTAHMRASLTYYMVPDVLVQLDEMPLTPNGKIDKKALPEVKRERKKSGRKAPKKSLEQELCELFAAALSLDEYYPEDNFFEMGGTSLSASKIVMQLMSKDVKVEYQDVFENPTPELLAERIEALRPGAAPTGERELGSAVQSVYPEQLQYNTMEYAPQVKREPLGDVLLTGALGFLGIHVLRELIDRNEGRVVCLVRRGKFPSAEKRIKSMLFYYFNNRFEELIGDRVQLVEADITDDGLLEKLAGHSFDTIINCAACVKHYAADDILERINVHGVENMIRVATERNARLIQISTVSIPGAHTEETWKLGIKARESALFVIDDLGNKYSISKYHAELKMLEAIKNGMRGKIIRVGNLMGRQSDGEFQINFTTNAFMNGIRGFATLGKCPISHATDPMSVSPIDMTARAVVLLAGTNDMFTAFNADSRFLFDEWQMIEAANRAGIKITPVPDEEYYADYRRMLGDPKMNARLQGLMTNDRPDLHGVETENKFTANVLYRLGFSWPLPSEEYLEKALTCLLDVGYFEPDEE